MERVTERIGREWLDLSGNQLSEVPPELGSLSSREWLDLSGNQLSGVPPELGSLSRLESLATELGDRAEEGG